MFLRIAVDLDGTVVDFQSKFRKRIFELYGVSFGDEHIDIIDVYNSLPPNTKKKYVSHYELYGDICNSGFFLDLKPYPGAVEAVNSLIDDGHYVFFLTKALNWDRAAPEKAVWLEKHFGDKKYRTIMVDSIKAKHLISADIIIDDDAKVLDKNAFSYPPIRICIAQPWNKTFREKNDSSLFVANSLEEAVVLINEKIIITLDEWNTIWCN